jgi:dipeptidyl aminopeptidase/acylaminoacyl peptidase
MKLLIALLLLLVCCYVTTFAQEEKKLIAKKEIGNLVLDGIPDLPTNTRARAAQYLNVRSAAFYDWQPDGAGMLIATRFGDAAQLHHVSAPGAYRRQITFFSEPINAAWYAPHSDQHGFIFSMDVGGGEFYQFYWFDEKTGQYSLLTDGKSRNENLLWSNRGDSAVFSSTKRNGADFDIYLMAGADANKIKLLKELSGEWAPLDWSPDDRQLILRHYISINESYLFLFDIASGEMKEINPTNGNKKIAYGDVKFARDGKGVYYAADEDSEFLRLVYYDLASGKKTIITPDLNWDVANLAVSLDGKRLAYDVNEGGISRLYLAAISEPIRAHVVEMTAGVISDMKFDRASARLGFTLTTPASPADAYSLDLANNKVTRWTFSEVGGLNADSFVAPELIEYATFDAVNGKTRMIPAFYYKPRNQSDKPFPVVIYIHGGPESQSQASFNSTIQYMINELGVAVMMPNVRGSSGYGKTYLELDNGYKREDSVKDIGKLIDWIATRPELDARRIAVAGGSYGGYMTLASMTHFNDRLKCAIDVVGISNFVTFLESTQEYRRNLRRPEYGDERDPKMREFLISISPTTSAAKITKPLMVVQGLNDPRVPVTEATQMVQTVRGNGNEVWYLLAKDEGHGFKKKTNLEFYLGAIGFFLESHLLK